MSYAFKEKRVLVFGLGMLNGGVAATNWLLDHGAYVTVTDLKNAEALASSIKRIEEHLKRTARDGVSYEKTRTRLAWALGGHNNKMIDAADAVVVNPDVSAQNQYIVRALKRGAHVCNEGTIFYDTWKKPTVGVTGTRGKTTTATWARHLIGTAVLTGNSVAKPFLMALDESPRHTSAVTELPSFILELFGHATRGPHIAVITNLYRDHLNRHGTMEEYAKAKARIFEHQTEEDFLILNSDNEWTEWFLKCKPVSQTHCYSLHSLQSGVAGVWYAEGAMWQRTQKMQEKKVLELGDFAHRWGMHNVANLLASALAAHLSGVSWTRIQSRLASLPQVQYRQEVVHHDAKITVVNDTTATSPEGGISALRRWGGPNCILICGGTDRELDYRQWAKELADHISRTNVLFLKGSATDKMRTALGRIGVSGVRTYDSLAQVWDAAQKRAKHFVSATILFSPAAKSFELFTNEFDRGQKFNQLAKESLKS